MTDDGWTMRSVARRSEAEIDETEAAETADRLAAMLDDEMPDPPNELWEEDGRPRLPRGTRLEVGWWEAWAR